MESNNITNNLEYPISEYIKICKEDYLKTGDDVWVNSELGYNDELFTDEEWQDLLSSEEFIIAGLEEGFLGDNTMNNVKILNNNILKTFCDIWAGGTFNPGAFTISTFEGILDEMLDDGKKYKPFFTELIFDRGHLEIGNLSLKEFSSEEELSFLRSFIFDNRYKLLEYGGMFTKENLVDSINYFNQEIKKRNHSHFELFDVDSLFNQSEEEFEI